MNEHTRTIETIGDLVTAYRQHLALGSVHSLRAFLPLATALEPLRDHPVSVWSAADWRQWFEEHCRMTATGQPMAPNTRALRYRHLRAMYGYPGRWLGQKLDNPFEHGGWKRVVPAAGPQHKPILTDSQVVALSAAPRTARTKLMIRLMLERGLRVGEVLAIKAGDLEDIEAGADDKRVLQFPHTKAGREQWTVLPVDLAGDLRDYIREGGFSPGARIFPISATAARAMVHRAAKSQGLALSPHDLRRGLCGRLRRAGVPLSMITALMRHSHEAITENHYIAEHTAAELAAV